MGHRGSPSEVRDSLGASAPFLRSQKRRATLRVWCGVVFLFILPSCAASDGPATPSSSLLTIGVPEPGASGPELGLGQLISLLTLEGLTDAYTSVDGHAVPRLAESWQWESHGLRLRMHLRNGVHFHDGTPLTAEVAATALQREVMRTANRALHPSVEDIVSIRADGDREIIFELSRPSAFLPEELDIPIGIGPENVGTGAFRLVTNGSEGVKLQRFNDYYLGQAGIEQIVVRPSDTLRTSWSRLLRGEVDMVTDVPPDAVEVIRNDDIQVISFPRSYQFLIAFNSQLQPFRSAAVRRALNTAVNREALITKVLQGEGEPATGPLWPKHWAYDASVQAFGFDQRGAVSLLESAGFRMSRTEQDSRLSPARLRFTCILPANFLLLERLALEVQKQLYDIGVDIRFEVVPFREYTSRIREGRFQAVMVDMTSGPTLARPHIFWGSARRDGLHAFGYDNIEAAHLFESLRMSTNEAATRSAVRRLQRVLLDEPPALFLVWNERARAVRREFRIPNSGRDPLFTIWQWTENTDRGSISNR